MRTRAAASDVSAIAQIALRDDYDPVVFLFCLNALFLSVVINVVNYGMEKDEETGMLKMPEGGGVGAILDKTKRGMADYFMALPKQLKEMYAGKDEALERAIEELEDAKMAAYAARGTALAERRPRRSWTRGEGRWTRPSPSSELLNPGLPSNTE